MKFFRERLIHRVQNGVLPNGGVATAVVVDQTERTDIILGNGSSSFNLRDPNDPSAPPAAVVSVPISTDFDDNRYELDIANHSQIYVNAKVLALGAGIDGLEVLIEFLDPDHVNDDGTGLWIPSKEGVTREADESGCIWGPLTVGNFSLASRAEMFHFKKARVSFRASGGTADAATRIHVSWFHDGKVPVVPEQ